jgi:UPF0042 nucleotide-binding protein
MSVFREAADVIIDTSNLTPQDLRSKIAAYFGSVVGGGLRATVVSFGYKFGLPLDADLVLDVRFLPNPHWVEGLRELTGHDEAVRDYVLGQVPTKEFLERMRDLFEVLLPGYMNEGRHYLTVAIGCTGGRHRSVVLAEEIAGLIEERGLPATVLHRDVARAPVAP